MKKCPQCSTVYGDEVVYCLNDGATLVEESPSLSSKHDSDEPETIIRSEPIVIDFGTPEAPPAPDYSVAHHPAAEHIVVVPADPVATTRNYALFLILGLLIGGGLVLGTLLLSRNLYQSENTNTLRANVNLVQSSNSSARTDNLKPSPTLSVTAQNTNAPLDAASNKHNEPNEAAVENTNGRVIALNARVRFAPDKDAPVVDTLPMDDRLEIIRRQNSNSPWFQVECEHGTTGWMHGDTIEFTR